MTEVGANTLQVYRASPGGVYRSEQVIVRRRDAADRRQLDVARTPRFDVGWAGRTLLVEHDITAEEVSDDVAGLLSTELFDPGWVRGPEVFEELLVGIVLSCVADPRDAWITFYRNTLDRIDREISTPTGLGSIAAYAPVHAHVAEVVSGRSVLEVGSCFGFQALRLARAGLTVTASDIAPGSVNLLAEMAGELNISLSTLVADAAQVGLPDRSVDTVLAIHLLEHVSDDMAARIIREACRIARRRVVVAVPFEDEPAQQFGHLRSLTLDDLAQWARGIGWEQRRYEHHGGWLVLDRR